MPEAPAPKKSSAFPSYVKTARQRSDAFLPEGDLRLGSLDIETLRNTARNTPDLIRKLSKASPDFSASVYTLNRLAITSYTVVARNLDGTINPKATQTAQELCRKFDFAAPAKGFNDFPTIRSASESLLQELFWHGAMCVELVLDSARMPAGFRPISVFGLKFKYDSAKKRRVPYQIVGGDEVSLDFPTVVYTHLDQDLLEPYAESPAQSALQPLQAAQSFLNDIRRVIRRAVQPRVKATVQEEEFRKTVPNHILHDEEKLQEYAEKTILGIKDTLDNLGPEDCLALFSSVQVDYMSRGNESLSDEYETISEIFNGKASSGLKTPGVVLGHANASSQNVASSQSMLFVKNVESLQHKLEELFSRALSVAIRLYGHEATCQLTLTPSSLRPQSELAAYKGMEQSSVLEQLSLGLISDEEASISVTGTLPPEGYTPLAGTMFKNGSLHVENPNSQTSVMDQTLQPDTPDQKKS